MSNIHKADRPKSHQEIITLLGGPTALARALDVKPVNTAVHWRRRGIPGKYRQKIAELIATMGIQLRSSDWESLACDTSEKRFQKPRANRVTDSPD